MSLNQPRILVPFDFSPAAERALDWTAALVRLARGGAVELVHAMSALPLPGAIEPLPPTPDDLGAMERALIDAARRHQVEATAKVLVVPSIGPAVVAEAKDWRADLIVMGTQGRGAVARLFLGSVADHVVRNASCPVVTMHAPAPPEV